MHLPTESSSEGNASICSIQASSEPSLARARVHNVVSIAKQKTRDVLHIEQFDNNDEEEHVEKSGAQETFREIIDSPAFNNSRLLNRARIGQTGIPDKVIATIQATGHFIVSPKAALKTRATRKTAGRLANSQPYLSKDADLKFLEAYDDLHNADGARDHGNRGEGPEKGQKSVGDCEGNLKRLEAARESMRVAWLTTRHVQRVRVIEMTPPPPLNNAAFEKLDEYGYKEFQWGNWLTYNLLRISHSYTAQYVDDFDSLPYDTDTLRRHIERFITVSGPLQAFLSDIRHIYRWDDPFRTGKLMALYFFLWTISHIGTFFWGYIIYSCIMNYYYPTSVEELRNGIRRSIDRGATALKIGEMIDQHGSKEWLEPLLDEIGPYLQVQLVDIANFFEVVYNFYHWSSPSATRNSLCLMAALFILAAFGDYEFLMKGVWFVVGFCFFINWPISSLYPRYRLIVSPFKVLFWDVPTHAELCFQYLNGRASVARQAILSSVNNKDPAQASSSVATNTIANNKAVFNKTQAPCNCPEKEREVLNLTCTYLGTPGKFIILTSGLRFEPLSKLSKHEALSKSYSELVEMTKRTTTSSILSPLAKALDLDKLELKFIKKEGGEHPNIKGRERPRAVLLENMKERDKAFNAIIGFSGLRWQNLQKEPDIDKKPTK